MHTKEVLAHHLVCARLPLLEQLHQWFLWRLHLRCLWAVRWLLDQPALRHKFSKRFRRSANLVPRMRMKSDRRLCRGPHHHVICCTRRQRCRWRRTSRKCNWHRLTCKPVSDLWRHQLRAWPRLLRRVCNIRQRLEMLGRSSIFRQ